MTLVILYPLWKLYPNATSNDPTISTNTCSLFHPFILPQFIQILWALSPPFKQSGPSCPIGKRNLDLADIFYTPSPSWCHGKHHVPKSFDCTCQSPLSKSNLVIHFTLWAGQSINWIQTLVLVFEKEKKKNIFCRYKDRIPSTCFWVHINSTLA